tara:strand:- start:128 stop:472 length:345 start_codon:yes stop_codon:yes gene_type:complete
MTISSKEKSMLEAMFEEDYEAHFPPAVKMTPTGSQFRKYVLDGEPIGGFLTTLFENNLAEAAVRADPTNLEYLGELGKFIFHKTPGACWGCKQKVKAWQERGGFVGLVKAYKEF